MIKAILLYQAGFIQKAKKITDKKQYNNLNMQRIVRRIDSISLAVTKWDAFTGQIKMPICKIEPKPFNSQVLMIVNSCAKFDSNGYAVRSTQIKKALETQSLNVSFCARLGYPWDMRSREGWALNKSVNSNEGKVWLQHDPNWLVGQSDPEYWNAYAEHIKNVINLLPEKPTILHAHSKYSNGVAAAMAGRQLGIPVVYEMRGLWHLTRAQRESTFLNSDFFHYEERLELWAAELADAVVVISSTLRDWLVHRSISKEKILVQPNAVSHKDAINFQMEEQDPTQTKFKLAFMGSLTAYEGVDTVLEAVAILKEQHITVTLDIYGDGQYRKFLEDFSKKLNLDTQVTFHGQVARQTVQSQLKKFSLFPIMRKDSKLTRLIPPLKHLEPMLAGRAVLVSKLPALLENVPAVIAKHALTADDSLGLANKIKELMLNPDEIEVMGRVSQRWVMTYRRWDQNAKRYVDLYSKLTNKSA